MLIIRITQHLADPLCYQVQQNLKAVDEETSVHIQEIPDQWTTKEYINELLYQFGLYPQVTSIRMDIRYWLYDIKTSSLRTPEDFTLVLQGLPKTITKLDMELCDDEDPIQALLRDKSASKHIELLLDLDRTIIAPQFFYDLLKQGQSQLQYRGNARKQILSTFFPAVISNLIADYDAANTSTITLRT